MKYAFRMAVVAASGLAVALAASVASAGVPPTCKISQGQLKMLEQDRLDQFLFVGASRNTDKGDGNGSEIAIFGYFCFSGLEVTDSDFGIDANDLGGFIATDPGNSNQ